jgi:hypothetical protein
MFTEDFILRMISQAVSALLQIAGYRQARQYQQAQQAIDQSLEELLGLRADLLKLLDDDVIFRMLTMNDQFDIGRALVIGELFQAEGELLADQDRPDASRQSFLRALSFYLEAGLAENPAQTTPRQVPQIGPLASLPEIQPLPDDLQWSLFIYFERIADYTRADAVLTELAGRPGLFADLRAEMIAFYQHLLELPPAEQTRLHIDRQQVQKKLANVSGNA